MRSAAAYARSAGSSADGGRASTLATTSPRTTASPAQVRTKGAGSADVPARRSTRPWPSVWSRMRPSISLAGSDSAGSVTSAARAAWAATSGRRSQSRMWSASRIATVSGSRSRTRAPAARSAAPRRLARVGARPTSGRMRGRRPGSARSRCARSRAAGNGVTTHTSRTPELRSVASAKSMKRYLPANGVSAGPPGPPSVASGVSSPSATMIPRTRPRRPIVPSDSGGADQPLFDPPDGSRELCVASESRREPSVGVVHGRAIALKEPPDLRGPAPAQAVGGQPEGGRGLHDDALDRRHGRRRRQHLLDEAAVERPTGEPGERVESGKRALEPPDAARKTLRDGRAQLGAQLEAELFGLVAHDGDAERGLRGRQMLDGRRAVARTPAPGLRDLVGRTVRGDREDAAPLDPGGERVRELASERLVPRKRMDVVEQQGVEGPELAPEGCGLVGAAGGEQRLGQIVRGEARHATPALGEPRVRRVQEVGLADAARPVQQQRPADLAPGERRRRSVGRRVALAHDERGEALLGRGWDARHGRRGRRAEERSGPAHRATPALSTGVD